MICSGLALPWSAVSIDPYLAGDRLFGDDFDQRQVETWFESEREGYASLGAGSGGSAETYSYHALNRRHGFRHLPSGRFPDALGIGSAFGGEFLPVIDRIDRLTILEPSLQLRSAKVGGLPVRYVDPSPTGDMPFADGSFDLVLALEVLHHVPNVTHVVAEIGRVTRPGGWVLLSDPVTSMGDWRQPRPGLTPNERGIPLPLFRKAFAAAGLAISRETPCMFPTTRRLARFGLGFNSPFGVALDHVLSLTTVWNDRYHAVRPWHKVHPTARYFVLFKPH